MRLYIVKKINSTYFEYIHTLILHDQYKKRQIQFSQFFFQEAAFHNWGENLEAELYYILDWIWLINRS